jgi:L-asparaginase
MTGKIVFIQTGGTIDKDYPQGATNHGYEFQIGEPAFISILNRANPDFEYEITSIAKKDSLDLTDEDRKIILETVKNSDTDKIVITHGTDTIHITAKVLSEVKNKTIILTGAMLPEKFYDSDADFNVGMAVGAVQSLSFGVYVCLYGKVLPWDKFKNK